MIFLRPYLTFFNLTIIIIFEIFILFCILYFSKYIKPTKCSTIHDYIRYIDKYYITNIYLTSSAVLLYIICHILLLLFFRYVSLSTTIVIVPRELSVDFMMKLWPLFFILVKFLLIIIAIVLFYYILDLIFLTSVIQLYIYFSQKSLMFNLKCNITESLMTKIIGPIYLFIDNISTLNLALSENNYDNHYEHRNIYDYDFILTLHIKLILLCEQYYFIRLFFIILKKFLRLCYIHYNLDFLVYFIPGVAIFSTFMYDVLVEQSFHYIYVNLFIISILRLLYKVYIFIDHKTSIFDGKLYNYFYKNSLPYEKQHRFITNENYSEVLLEESLENSSLIYYLHKERYQIYIIQDFIRKTTCDSKTVQKRINALYIRFTFIICYIILSIYFIRNYFEYTLYLGSAEFPSIILVLPLIVIYYIHLQVYKKKPDARIDDFSTYIYNKTFAIIFWILILIQGYIFWLLIFKSYIFYMPDEYLFNNYNIQLIIKLKL